MYSTCIFCHRELGSNRTMEEFPVGRFGRHRRPRGADPDTAEVARRAPEA